MVEEVFFPFAVHFLFNLVQKVIPKGIISFVRGKGFQTGLHFDPAF